MAELNEIQAAYWVGRQNTEWLGGVAAHLYAEFDSDAPLDIGRLRQAVRRLHAAHPMLRLQVTDEGRQSVVALDAMHDLTVDDMRDLDSPTLEASLADKRQSKSHQRLALDRGCVTEISVSVLPEGRWRLHVDVDMIAADPASFLVLMEDLARCYEAPDARFVMPSVSYLDYLACLRSDRELARLRERDRRWWRGRLAQIPSAPPLPWRDATGPVHSERFSALLGAEERRSLEATARRHNLTLSTLMLALFADVLGTAAGASRFRLNVPMFYRHPLCEGVEKLVGDFSNLLVLGVELTPEASLAALGERLAAEMSQLLSHSAYSGVSVMRDLSRHHGSTQVSPVVFTAGLDVPGGELFSQRVTRNFGKLAWVVSQGPMVALDAQVASAYGGLLINWDVRLDALPEPWVTSTFDAYVERVKRLARSPEAMRQTIDFGSGPGVDRSGAHRNTVTGGRPLTPLQQAYLLGRSERLPLGGVAMQEFREYRGRLDPAVLHRRLAQLVRHHDALRTWIDVESLTQRVAEEAVLHLDELDLREVPRGEAWERIAAMRGDYAHRLFDPSRPPWHLLLFRLPEPEDPTADSCVIFVRFDALIVDGRAIAHLMATLFESQESTLLGEGGGGHLAASPAMPPRPRDEAAAYWAETLRSVTGPPQLPWKRPLDTLGVSRYRRESLTLPRADLASLSRLGASYSLLRNSVLTAIVLDVLARWTSDAEPCVAVPVALPARDGRLENDSTFIALRYDAQRGTLLERARRVQTDVLQALEHLSFSGVDINRLLLRRNASGVALPVAVTNGLSWETLAPDAPVRCHGGLTQTPQTAMDIRLTLDEQRNLVLSIDHAEQALDTELVRDVLEAIERAIGAVIRRGELVLTEGDCLDPAQCGWNGAEGDSECSHFLARTAQCLFDSDGGKAALIHGDRRITYGELGVAVLRVMSGLQQHGLDEGDVVAICLPRGPEHLMLTLACALQGLIWVPVEAGAPDERRRFLLANCHPGLVVASAPVEGFRVTSPEQLLEAAPAQRPSLEDLVERSSAAAPAYYLYTSGTTGKPKCVVLSNRATANVIGCTQAAWRIGAEDVFLSATPLHHDMSVFDVFGSLSAGATLVLPTSEEEKDAIHWNRLVREHGVSVWCSVPTILEMLLACHRNDSLRSLRLIAQGGDYIKPATIAALRRLLPNVRLFSLGGPTETTIWSIWHEIAQDDVDVIPYGRPLPGNRYFVCNEAQMHCPPSVVGRIYTAGINLALGYLKDGELQQSDFVTLSDERGRPVRAFRTGDLGRYRRDGTLLFAGRVNGYVKVRGVRVSLPDIENELSGHPGVRQVLVVDHEVQSGETALGALYVAAGDDEISVSELRRFARHHLPESHVPGRYLRVAVLPLSGNGKPDRQEARRILTTAVDASSPVRRAAPSPAGRVLAIYREVIGKPGQESCHERSDFLAMGLLPSHLQAIASRLDEAFGVRPPIEALMRCRTAEEVARLLQRLLPRSVDGAPAAQSAQGLSVDR
ncbi:MAG: amino acid adenylation domain-containing protein [Pseudomonadota bacterium]